MAGVFFLAGLSTEDPTGTPIDKYFLGSIAYAWKACFLHLSRPRNLIVEMKGQLKRR